MSHATSENDSESEEEVQVESLVSGRERRANAGNRMATLLATEEPSETPGEDDDDLKLLFEENAEEEDAEFASGDEAVSDVEMDSSSDEDDGKEDDEEAGEKEIERQAKEERKRKRKALETFGANKKRKVTDVKTTTAVKKVTIVSPTEPRPKKKSERVSWLPVQEEGPVRASSRRQTMQNKEVVHERMIESEKKRRQQLKAMEVAAKKKEAARAKALTQQDRLDEAARVEARNAKTLNRWEATERKRVEEQRAKLAALKNKGLKGSVMTIWSGPSQWVDGKCIAIGRNTGHENKKVEGKRGDVVSASKSKVGARATHEPPLVTPGSASVPPAITLSAAITLQSPTTKWNTPMPGNPFFAHSGEDHSIIKTQSSATSSTTLSGIQNIEIQSRTLIGLDEAALKEPLMQDSVLVKARKSGIKIHGKLPEKEKCLITGLHARYRDPRTGVPYANITAFKQLRINESTGGYTNGRWSTLLGQYVGSDLDAPNAVPRILKTGA